MEHPTSAHHDQFINQALQASPEELARRLYESEALVQALQAQNSRVAGRASGAGTTSGNDAPSSAAVIKVLRDKLHIFKGQRNLSAIRTYLHRLDKYFEAAYFSEAERLTVASSYLELHAEVWWLTHQKSHPRGTPHHIATWDAYKEAIQAYFTPANSDKATRDKIARLRQTGSVQDYLGKFNELCLEITDIAESEKLDKFFRGLKPKIQEQLALNPDTTVDLARMSSAVDRIDQIQYAYSRNQYSSTTHRTPVTQANLDHRDIRPMEIDNLNTTFGRLTKLTDTEKAELRSKGACFKCRQVGHISALCPLRKQPQGNGKKTQ